VSHSDVSLDMEKLGSPQDALVSSGHTGQTGAQKWPTGA
jgi:hypothetical protein